MHVSAGEGGWGPLAAMGLTRVGAAGGLLRSPLGKGPSPGEEPELAEGPRGQREGVAGTGHSSGTCLEAVEQVLKGRLPGFQAGPCLLLALGP